jgi:hypothetical protein
MPVSPGSGASAVRRDAGLLTEFLEKTILLTGLYLFINSVFNQAYLRHFQLHVGLIELGVTSIANTDAVIITYILLMYIALLRVPDLWYSRIAEFATPENWLTPKYWQSVPLSLSFLWFTLNIAQWAYFLFRQRFEGQNMPHSLAEMMVPTLGTLSHPATCGTLLLILSFFVVAYTVFKRRRNWNPGFTSLYGDDLAIRQLGYLVGVPFIVLFVFILVLFAIPGSYGTMKARIDIIRMAGSASARIQSIVVEGQTCLPTHPSSSNVKSEDALEYYEYSPSVPDIHLVGQHAGSSVFVVFRLVTDEGQDSDQRQLKQLFRKQRFKLCLVQDSQIHSIEILGR